MTHIDFVNFCKKLGIEFLHQRSEDLNEEYLKFYNSPTSKKQPKKHLKQGNISHINIDSFVCSLNIKGAIDFIINPANMVHRTHYKEAVQIHFWVLQVTLQKRISVDKEDEKGKFFIYEDIQLHSPKSYPIFKHMTSFIKSET